MENDPKKWERQAWSFPEPLVLVREKDQWYIEIGGWLRIPVQAVYGRQTVEYLNLIHQRERRQ